MKRWLKENIVAPWRTREERKGLKTGRISSLFIELTNRCNFNCDFCTYGFMKREKRHMDFTLACRILDEIAKEKIVDRISPHFVGEPLLYPYLFEFLERAKDKAVCVALPRRSKELSTSKGISGSHGQTFVTGIDKYSAKAPSRLTPIPLVWGQR